ncbi:MAG: hypothetical protein KGS61_09400 [Verrucomicrobia bacterium]|nr:hypothetical protein [Verrucomicrobiota bacterium]
MKLALLNLGLLAALTASAAVPDISFLQDSAVKYAATPELQGAACERLAIDRNGIVYVLTDKGLARLFGDTLALDRSYRPLAGKRPVDVAVGQGHLFYLFPDRLLSNDDAGKLLVPLPTGVFTHLGVADDGTILLYGSGKLAAVKNGEFKPMPGTFESLRGRIYPVGNEFYLLNGNAVDHWDGQDLGRFHAFEDVTALAFRGHEMLLGTRNGFYGMDLVSTQATFARQTVLPATHITCLLPTKAGLWVGTTGGAFHKTAEGSTDYYASQRWLADDEVVEMQPATGADVWILTRTGLNRIHFQLMTLAEKAAYFDRKVRERHIRYGFCAERHLFAPGDLANSEMIDSDNDGTWSEYYLASQAFRYAATGSEEARTNAWETFAAIQRLESINGLDGFPSRSFERRGFKVADPERWHPTKDGEWEWKGTTSSDEFIAHTFGCAVLYETAARTAAERDRIRGFYDKVMAHILRNDLKLVDVDGQPTQWGRWDPAYVNHYPHRIFDRRLNSAEIIAGLQFAFAITGKDLYRRKAADLMQQDGYLENIMSSMTNIAYTSGYSHQGAELGTDWNHSDDLLGFDAYWVLHRFAFNAQLQAQFDTAIRDHWEVERGERCPLWNFIYASTGAYNFDLNGALWTLRKFPLDLVDWTVHNSQRQDIHRLPPNFRERESVELLPPDERRIMRWNGNPFVLDGGNGGRSELAGDEFLLPYWMARYLKIIR